MPRLAVAAVNFVTSFVYLLKAGRQDMHMRRLTLLLVPLLPLHRLPLHRIGRKKQAATWNS
jgi:hypothetical protein